MSSDHSEKGTTVRISIVVAYDEDRVIGNNGEIPWSLPEDFKHFRQLTMGHICVMGRKTWASLPEQYRPLPGRLNFVISRSEIRHPSPSVLFFKSIQECVELANMHWKEKEMFVIGGAEIYKLFLDSGLVDRVVASEVYGLHGGDTFFPELPLEGLELVKSRKVLQNFDDFRIVEYVL